MPIRLDRPVIATSANFEAVRGASRRRGKAKRALLINPPVYDAQYWARWSQPAGLLRLATYLKNSGMTVDLIDAMETDSRGFVRKRWRKLNDSPVRVVRDDITKIIWHFGLDW